MDARFWRLVTLLATASLATCADDTVDPCDDGQCPDATIDQAASSSGSVTEASAGEPTSATGETSDGSTGEPLMCAPQLDACAGECVELASDLDHCGACDTPCLVNESCVDGVCVVDCGALTSCEGVCRDLLTNSDHCGDCDSPCGESEVCAQGVCIHECGQFELVCGPACVDILTDPAHCGACDAQCDAPVEHGVGACDGLGVCTFDCEDYYQVNRATCVPCDDSEILADGPLHYWRLSELNDATAVDAAGDANGEYVDAVELARGQDGALSPDDKAVQFTPGFLYPRVRVADFTMPATEFTIELVTRLDDLERAFHTFLSMATSDFQNNEVTIAHTLLGLPKGLVVVIGGNTFIKSETTLNDGSWHHVAITWKSVEPDPDAEVSGGLRLYIDGDRVGTNDAFSQGHAIAPGGALIFGQEQDALDGGYDLDQTLVGTLDSVVIYDVALPEARIKRHADSTQCK